MIDFFNHFNWGGITALLQLMLLLWAGVRHYAGEKLDAAAMAGVKELIENDDFCTRLAARVVQEINGKFMYAKRGEVLQLQKSMEAQADTQLQMHKDNAKQFAEIREQLNARRGRRTERE